MALIALVFGQTLTHDFVQYDDPIYVSENPVVQRGLTREGVVWAFKHGADANYWTPLTWLSHMLDVQLFGPRAGPHHLVSVVLHAINSILLYFLLKKLTGAVWPSAFVGAMFAIHPLHVESVAWIAERKDTLSTLFFLLAIFAYVAYARAPSVARYLLVLALYVLGLMAKPMVMTLPGVLLLLDYWPLGRLRGLGVSPEQSGDVPGGSAWAGRPSHLLLEKLPFVALAIACAAITFVAQKHAGAVRTVEQFPISFRIENAIVSYARYVGKTFCPTNLTVFYPPPDHWPIAIVVCAAMLLALITAIAIATRRSKPYLLVGWLWFLGTLLPVIGLVQVGRQAMADRYSYIPHIGLFIMVAFFAATLKPPRLIAALGIVAIIAATARSIDQVQHWQNTQTLFRHALQVTGENEIAHNQIGNVLVRQRNYGDAEFHYRQAVRIDPQYYLAQMNLGNVLMHKRAFAEAAERYRAAIAVKPDLAKAHLGLAMALKGMGNLDQAGDELRTALRLDPDLTIAQQQLDQLKRDSAGGASTKSPPSSQP